MPAFRSGVVTAVLSERPGLQKVEVDGDKAYVLTQLIGTVVPGDRVVMNTTAVDLGLGTGGWHFVHWNLERDEWSQPGPGHIMKLRYTSLQADTGAPEEDAAASLGGVPIVACALHSQLPVVAAAIARHRPGTRVAYVMTDGGALPMALSDLVADLCEKGLLHTTITAGQAFGGAIEAVNLHSALALAADQGAEVIAVATGPGVVGTGTALGFSGMEVATAIDAAGRLGAIPVVALRYSEADERDRHRGVSHHTRTALAFAHEVALLAAPAGWPEPSFPPHRTVAADTPDPGTLLEGLGLSVTTMGRGPAEDPGFFAFAAAAGVVAAELVDDPSRYPRQP